MKIYTVVQGCLEVRDDNDRVICRVGERHGRWTTHQLESDCFHKRLSDRPIDDEFTGVSTPSPNNPQFEAWIEAHRIAA